MNTWQTRARALHSSVKGLELTLRRWAIIADPTFADAILDRLFHHTHRIALDRPSMHKNVQPAPAEGQLKETALWHVT